MRAGGTRGDDAGKKGTHLGALLDWINGADFGGNSIADVCEIEDAIAVGGEFKHDKPAIPTSQRTPAAAATSAVVDVCPAAAAAVAAAAAAAASDASFLAAHIDGAISLARPRSSPRNIAAAGHAASDRKGSSHADTRTDTDTETSSNITTRRIGSAGFHFDGMGPPHWPLTMDNHWMERRPGFDEFQAPLAASTPGTTLPAGGYSVGFPLGALSQYAACCTTEVDSQNTDPDALADEEERQWIERQRCTGSVGKMVVYNAMDRPADDFTLRGGAGRPVVVTGVRQGGPAWKAGVREGDRLVSVEGSKEFLELAADDVRLRLHGPVTLVFCGFVGKLQAEVRLNGADPPFGLDATETVLNTPQGKVTLIEDRVLGNRTSSLFLSVHGSPTRRRGSGARQQISPTKRQGSVLELQQTDARNLLRKAQMTSSEWEEMEKQAEEEPAGIDVDAYCGTPGCSPRCSQHVSTQCSPDPTPRCSPDPTPRCSPRKSPWPSPRVGTCPSPKSAGQSSLRLVSHTPRITPLAGRESPLATSVLAGIPQRDAGPECRSPRVSI